MRVHALLLLTLSLTACAPMPFEIEEVSGTQAGLRVCVSGATVEGVDVSSWQGAIDWSTYASRGGRPFAFARVADGLYVDSRFDGYYPAMRAAGVIRGSYQFFRPAESASAQADLFLRHVPSLLPGDLPPVLDVEAADGVSAAHIVAGIHTWVDRVRAALGRDPMIYTGYYFWHDSVGDSSDFASLPLWIAAYPTACTDTGGYCPLVPGGWSSWTFWQYCDTSSVAGIADTSADLDVFMGSRAELEALAGMSSSTPVPPPPPPPPASDGGTPPPPPPPPVTDGGVEAGVDAGAAVDAGAPVQDAGAPEIRGDGGAPSGDAGAPSPRRVVRMTSGCSAAGGVVRPAGAFPALALLFVVAWRRRSRARA